jgi:two-component system sensor kinase FixL
VNPEAGVEDPEGILGPERDRAWVRYGYAVLAVAVALGAALALRSFDLEGFLFVIAVPVAVWLGGRGPGVLAIVLSVLVLHYVFIAPEDTGAILPSYAYFVVFSVLAVLITVLSEARHRAEESLVQARDELEVKVQERTAELQRSNRQLRDEVAERKRVEAELRRSEAFLAEGQRLTHAGSWRLYPSKGTMSWSREIHRILGHDPGTPPPTMDDVWVIYHPDDVERVRQIYEAALRDKADFKFECRVVLPDGSVRDVDCIAHAVVDESHELIEYVGTTMDVTERKAAEAEIRRQAELLNLAHDAVIARDLGARVTFWNRGAEETYGWSAAEALGRVTHELLQTTFPVAPEAIEAVTREHGKWEGELTHVRRDGTAIVVASRWSLQRDERGAPMAILEINRDVTDRKRAEEALRIIEAELAHVTRVTTLGEVTASFAHEVNQPLAAIANNANACLALLPDGRPDLDEVRAALIDITSDADRASRIIERVRALATRSPSDKVPLRLEDVVGDVVALAATESAARRVTILTAVAADLPVVSGDRVQLQQVLLNLVVNGMDAMTTVHEQGRLLEIRGRPAMQDGSLAATISVQDQGIGLDAAQVGRLFEAFYTTKPHGMGMGLAISRSIIEMHGGRLWAEANQGPGATFSFSVPAAASVVPNRG